MAVAGGSSYDATGISSGSVAKRRAGRLLRFRFAPSVYAAQVDDFSWWNIYVDAPLVDVIITINDQTLRQQEEGMS